jgi:hypothetical protein
MGKLARTMTSALLFATANMQVWPDMKRPAQKLPCGAGWPIPAP